MKILGIDLSSGNKDTAACLVNALEGEIRLEDLSIGCSDAALDKLINRAAVIGIDAPLGWPTTFTTAVAEWADETWSHQSRDKLRFRLTDDFVRGQLGLTPLSVSTDRIALPAMRAMALLKRHGAASKSGGGQFLEVYPAATLKRWELPYKSYKGKKQGRPELRRQIFQAILGNSDVEWMSKCVKSDHALDATIACLSALVAHANKTPVPSESDKAVVDREGWIHFPTESLAEFRSRWANR